jgi:6-phosphogluconolactonase (cycloisomerase 2 family)
MLRQLERLSSPFSESVLPHHRVPAVEYGVLTSDSPHAAQGELQAQIILRLGNLTEVTNVATASGGEPVNVVAEPTGRFLYVEENSNTDIYSIDPTSGALALVAQQALPVPSYFTF